MKKTIVVGIAVLSLTLTACGNESFNDRGQAPAAPAYSEADRNPNNRSVYNDNTYCNGHTYVPLPGDEYQCEDGDHSGIIILPHTSRSKYTMAPKLTAPSTKPKAPAVTAPKAPAQAPKPAAPAPKPAAPKPAPAPYKAPAPAPKAPAPKTGK